MRCQVTNSLLTFSQFYFKMFDDDVEGEMTVTSKGRVNRGTPGSANFNTLDEPIKETFVSDATGR